MGQAFNFALVVLWIAAGAVSPTTHTRTPGRSSADPNRARSQFQYGFHISALNGVQDSITCEPLPLPSASSFPTCVPITNFGFGVLTSSFTIGGLLSSIYTGAMADNRGRRGTAIIAAVVTVAVRVPARKVLGGKLTPRSARREGVLWRFPRVCGRWCWGAL